MNDKITQLHAEEIPRIIRDSNMRSESYNRLGLYISVSIFLLIASGAVVAFLLLATAPRDIGAFGVTLWFLSLLIFIATAMTLIMYKYKRRRYPEIQERLKLFQKSLRTGILFGMFTAVGLAMQSLRMLNLSDVLLFLLTLGIIELYFRTKRHE